MKKLGLFICALLFSMCAFAEASVIRVTKNSPEFKITEPANPTTGYSWSVDYDHDLLLLETQDYVTKNSKLIGSGGKNIWVFKAKSGAFLKSNNQAQIKLIYSRSWELFKGPAKEMFFMVEFA